MINLNKILLLIFSLTQASCFYQTPRTSEGDQQQLVEEFPQYTYNEENVFPSSDSLILPEDGVGLPDGRLLVAHDDDGLHVITRDGSHRAFGGLKEAGYQNGGARGVFLENDGKHVLVSGVNSGELFRVNIETETSKIIYRHKYGINNIYKDGNENIWFSQSANNENGSTKALDEAFALPLPTGAVYWLRTDGNKVLGKAKLMADSLYFANGITMDEEEEYLYLAEFRMDRILRFRVDEEKDSLTQKEQYSIILSPDNLERDKNGNLWVASLIQNKIFAIDKDDRSRHEIFSAASEMNRIKQREWVRNNHYGRSMIDIGHPDMWNPLSGPLTGIFWSYDQEEVYFTGLGNKLLRFPYPGVDQVSD